MLLHAEGLLLHAEALLQHVKVMPEVVEVMPEHIVAKKSFFRGQPPYIAREPSVYAVRE